MFIRRPQNQPTAHRFLVRSSVVVLALVLLGLAELAPAGVAAVLTRSKQYDALLSTAAVPSAGKVDVALTRSKQYDALLSTAADPNAGKVDVALGKPASASSTESSSYAAAKANDNSTTTRWASAERDGEWWQVDLGSARTISGVSVAWETAYAARYQILTSLDGSTFTTAADLTASGAGTQSTAFAARSARYVRVVGVTRGTKWGISTWEVRVFADPSPVPGSGANLALGARTSASSIESSSLAAAKANDGNPATRWASAERDGEWWQVDLGSAQTVSSVSVTWETAYAARYQILTSLDGSTFTTAADVTASSAGLQQTSFAPRSARYVRIVGVARGTPYGISFWEAQVFGGGSSSAPPPAPPPAPPLPPPASSAPQWSVYEIPLSASGAYANPYTQASVSATFSGPGATKTVKGFWDGGSSWKIRFACTAQGTWSYLTSSADSGLNGQRGSFSCTAPAAGNHGFLRRDAANPRSFVWDDGSRYYMWGQTYYELIRNAIAGDTWKAAIDQSAAYGMNKVRLLVYPWNDTSVYSPYADSQPFAGPSSAPDHDSLNLAHWQKLDQVIRYLDSRGMVADVILYADAARVFGSQAQDDRYTRYAIARFAAYHNVIWCMTNEWDFTHHGQSYWDAEGSIVRNEDPWMSDGSNLRPLSIHQSSDLTFNYPASTHPWTSTAIIQLHGNYTPNLTGGSGAMTYPDEWGNRGITANAGLNVPDVNDEYGYIGDAQSVSTGSLPYSRTMHRQIIWGIATAGGYGSAADSLRLPSGEIPWMSADWKDEPGEYGDIQRLISFFTTKGVQYWRMASANAIAGGNRVYVLGEAGEEYVAYSALGGSFTLNLPAASAGSYQVSWYNPTTGASVGATGVSGSAVRTFTPPFGGDAVLRLLSR